MTNVRWIGRDVWNTEREDAKRRGGSADVQRAQEGLRNEGAFPEYTGCVQRLREPDCGERRREILGYRQVAGGGITVQGRA